MSPEVTAAQGRLQAVRQWSANPCGAEGDPVALSDFLRIERVRYLDQYWMHDLFRYEDYADRKVLEVGCGLGTDLAQFALAGAETHGVDLTPRHLELAQRNFRVRGLTGRFSRQDAAALSFPDHTFDAVYSFGVLHHIPDVERCVAEIHRVLKPGGRFMVGLYYRWSAFHLFHKLLYEGVARGGLLRLGYQGLLATIENGADGRLIKPYVRLYSRGEMDRLLDAFPVRETHVRQLHCGHFPNVMGYLVPCRLINRLHRRLGWYVVGLAEKSRS